MRHLHIRLTATLLVLAAWARAGEVVWFDGSRPVSYAFMTDVDPVARVAALMFADDMLAVTGRVAVETSPDEAAILISQVPGDGNDAIVYPVKAAALNARKHLLAQRARNSADTAADFARYSLDAHQQIASLTHYYNDTIAYGKWHGLMDMQPRDLPIFREPDTRAHTLATPTSDTDAPYIARNACDFSHASTSAQPIQMLGHSMNAVSLPAGASLRYDFTTIETAGHHTLTITALDPHIVVDQWFLDFNPSRAFYLFPL